MRLLRQLLHFALQHSLLAGGAAVALCWATESLVCSSISETSEHVHALLFGGVLLAYNIHFVWVEKISKSDDVLTTARKLILISGLIFLLYGLLQMPTSTYVWLVLMSLSSVLYSLPILPLGKRIKDFGVLKILTLTITWTIATTILPLNVLGISPAEYPLEIVLRFVFMLALCVAFDIRDLKIDWALGIKTVPAYLGVQGTRKLINLSLLLFLIVSVVQFFRIFQADRLIIEILVAVLTFFAIRYAGKMKTNYHYLLYVDGMMLLYGVAMSLKLFL